MTPESYTGSGPVAGYTSSNLTPGTILTVNYYDNYSFLSYSGNNPGSMLTSTTLSGYDNPAATTYAKTLLTGTRVYHLDNPTSFEVTANYYDKYGRVVQARSSNHLSGYDLVYNQLDFTGKPNKTYKTHGINGASATITELYTYVYDKAQRMLTTTYSLNGANAVTLVSNSYDELGRLYSKNLGGADATTYAYNVRSWTTGINGSRFSESLYYNANTANLPTFTPAYNGNIAGMQWSVANESGNRAYSFTYDGLNRLTDAIYTGFNGGVINGTQNRYDEHFGFDKMGNTTSFTRNGLLSSSGGYGTVDNLSFTYNGNQKVKITDAGSNGIFYGDEEFMQNLNNSGNSCAYDANGNRLYDSNSNIWGIRYNILNLPDAMQFYQGHQTNYTYSASGAKLKVIDKTAPAGVVLPVTSLNTILTNPSVSTTTTTDYVGNIIYENGTLKRILTPVGYWQDGIYYYFLKDHLGSNRVVMTGSGGIAETSSYYPSGMRFGESAVNGGSIQPYRHTGMEMQEMHGLNWYDNLARFRTVSDGSGFTGMDPHAEKHYNESPYIYCSDNPMKYIDPDGKEKIISLNPNIKSNSHLINAANKYADDKAIHIWGHGDSKSMLVYVNGKDVEIKSSKDFQSFLSNNSKTWQNKGENEHITIILHSCETGKENGKEPSIASEISKDLKNTTVIAPSDKVVVNNENDTEMGSYSTKTVEDNGKTKDVTVDKGTWNEFSNGENTESHPGDWQPLNKPEVLTGTFSLVNNK